MIDFVMAAWVGVIGACVGSFLNVVAHRLPRGISVVWKPSHCPQCGKPIRWHDNVPVVGWLRLRGRCRDCHEPIPPRYAIVEAVTGLLFFGIAYFDVLTPSTGAAGARRGGLPSEVAPVVDGGAVALVLYHGALASGLVLTALFVLDKTWTAARGLAVTALIAVLYFAPLALG